MIFEQTFRLDERGRLAAPHQFAQAITQAARMSPSHPALPRAMSRARQQSPAR
ncbi:MAG: hypothetical protein KGL48_00420 [Sphingomonadales bacterium]|nr:hypothetical protein [Sphingomonadales bacterium]MDE2567886.1 hypothetical protein [Sphingomonadales bacterium]